MRWRQDEVLLGGGASDSCEFNSSPLICPPQIAPGDSPPPPPPPLVGTYSVPWSARPSSWRPSLHWSNSSPTSRWIQCPTNLQTPSLGRMKRPVLRSNLTCSRPTVCWHFQTRIDRSRATTASHCWNSPGPSCRRLQWCRGRLYNNWMWLCGIALVRQYPTTFWNVIHKSESEQNSTGYEVISNEGRQGG